MKQWGDMGAWRETIGRYGNRAWNSEESLEQGMEQWGEMRGHHGTMV